jgi:hypothetical protein
MTKCKKSLKKFRLLSDSVTFDLIQLFARCGFADSGDGLTQSKKIKKYKAFLSKWTNTKTRKTNSRNRQRIIEVEFAIYEYFSRNQCFRNAFDRRKI